MHVWDLLAWVGAAISWWGTARYIISIAKGGTHPRLASWIAWATANGVLGLVALLHDSPVAAIFNGLAALGNVSVLVLSAIKRVGERPQGTTDWACLVTAGMCLATILIFPNQVFMDAILAMCANVIATWPTIQHAWHRPQEEAWQLFAANSGANALGLVSCFVSSGAALSNIAGPLISMIGNVSLVVITLGRGWLTSAVANVEEDVDLIRDSLVEPLVEPRLIRDIAPANVSTQNRPTIRRQKPRVIRSY